MAPKLESMTVTPAKNRGYVVTHRYAPKTSVSRGRNGGGFMISPQSEEHVFGPDQHKELVAHMAEHLGLSEAKEEAAEVPKK